MKQQKMERVFQNVNGTAFLDKGLFINKELLEQCVSYVEPQLEERPEIIIYGKPCKQHRNVGFFSDESIGYKYSKKLMASKPLSPLLTDLLESINKMLGTQFNGILVNKYLDGNDYIGAHSDDETGLDGIGVVAISYGSERIFRIRNKNDKTIVCDEPTTHCGILHMGGNFQKVYTHEIPMQKKIKESRISFTFRKHIV
jgi:alkylated DNA repair dioxygenase AlkB